MANSKVTVILKPGAEVHLTTDNPDIGVLVDEIVKRRESLDPEQICVTCEDVDNFDKESFAEIVRESTRQFLAAIKLEKEAFDTICASIDKEGSSM